MHGFETAGTAMIFTAISFSVTLDPIYFWQQTVEDITVCVRMPEGITKEDVQFRLTADTMTIGVQGFAPLLEGQLHASVDPEASAWIIKNDKRFAALCALFLVLSCCFLTCCTSEFLTAVFHLSKTLLWIVFCEQCD